MTTKFAFRLLTTTVVATKVLSFEAMASEFNLYSSRHYNTDERLYSDFTAATGIKNNRIEAKPDVLIKRIKAEGANSPVDVSMTVDILRINRAKKDGLLQATNSGVLNSKVPISERQRELLVYLFSARADYFLRQRRCC